MNILGGDEDLDFPVFLVCVYKAYKQIKIKLEEFACGMEIIIPHE